MSDQTTHRLRDETEELETDRDAVPSFEASANLPSPARTDALENSRFVSRFEDGTGTIALHDKRTGADQHTPVASEASRNTTDGVTENRSESRGSLAASFAAAKAVTATFLGDSAKTFVAQTQSGMYRGEVIGETNLHVVQRLSAQSAIAHMKQLLERTPEVGSTVIISYSNEKASIGEWRERARDRELTR